MALSKGTNSYVTVAEADAYFADRVDVVAWTSASAEQKSQALVTATAFLDEMSWTGIAVSDTQTLAFPRSGTYFDPRVGTEVVLDETVPRRVVQGVSELAYHLLNNDGLLDDTGGVVNLRIGSISLDSIYNPKTIPTNVKRIIKPLLINGGSTTWWRAN